jgi:hypothetical protein
MRLHPREVIELLISSHPVGPKTARAVRKLKMEFKSPAGNIWLDGTVKKKAEEP